MSKTHPGQSDEYNYKQAMRETTRQRMREKFKRMAAMVEEIKKGPEFW